jgi:hypothetical protein
MHGGCTESEGGCTESEGGCTESEGGCTESEVSYQNMARNVVDNNVKYLTRNVGAMCYHCSELDLLAACLNADHWPDPSVWNIS